MPRVEGTESLRVARPELWRLLNDPDTLAAAIPGCRGFERDDAAEHRYRTAIKVAVGAVTGVYEGTVEYVDVVEPERCTIVVSGKGDKGTIDGQGAITLAAAGEGTEVTYRGEFKLTGPVAGVGQRMAPGVSRKMIVETLRNLEKLGGAAAAGAPVTVAAVPAAADEGAGDAIASSAALEASGAGDANAGTPPSSSATGGSRELAPFRPVAVPAWARTAASIAVGLVVGFVIGRIL